VVENNLPGEINLSNCAPIPKNKNRITNERYHQLTKDTLGKFEN
jgi:hypothetical protein